MKRLELCSKQPIVIAGSDFLGRQTLVSLESVSKPGWYVHHRGEDFLIDTHSLQYHLRRIVFKKARCTLNVIEHLLALKLLLGIDSVRIIPETTWIPYGDSSARQFYDALVPHLKGRGGLAPYTVGKKVEVRNEKSNSWVSYAPFPRNTLVIVVHIDYKGLGAHTAEFSLSNIDPKNLAYARTQGWPASLWYASWLLPSGSTARRYAVWPHDGKPHEVLEAYAAHRALDILAALSALTPPGGALVGTVESHRGGHGVDIAMIQQARSLLVAV